MGLDRSRPDLVARLDDTRRSLGARSVTVAVVGEFKRGKSTLVNALIQREVCPVDADIVTAVPTLVRYGEQPTATAYRLQRAGHDEPAMEGRPVPLEDLAAVVSDTAPNADPPTQSVEVRVPHRILRSGLQLLDTPGVGGLESVHGQLALGSLTGVDGVLFVTDASQELTAPEMEFLRIAFDRSPRLALVVTKIDLHRQWRRIVELDRDHMSRAGLNVPVIPVSSLLRIQAARRQELNEESGFGALVEFLARGVVQPAGASAASQAAHEVQFAADQLAQQSNAERVVLARPERSAEVVDRLTAATSHLQALGAPNSTWQQLLSDGVQDLVADVEHDLQARLRSVLKDVRDMIDRSDPRDTWIDTGAWLRRQVAAAGVGNRDLLLQRADTLVEAVASEFNLAAGEPVKMHLQLATRSFDELQLPSAASLSPPGGRLASLLVTARTTALVPMVAMSVGALLPPVWIVLLPYAGGTLLATAGVGKKLFSDEGQRRRGHRQQQAKAAAAKFVEEAAFELNKETRDSLRRTQRLLRDEFQARARMLQASTTGALEAARRARALDPVAQGRRAAQLEQETTRLNHLRSDLRELTGAGAARG